MTSQYDRNKLWKAAVYIDQSFYTLNGSFLSMFRKAFWMLRGIIGDTSEILNLRRKRSRERFSMYIRIYVIVACRPAKSVDILWNIRSNFDGSVIRNDST